MYGMYIVLQTAALPARWGMYVVMSKMAVHRQSGAYLRPMYSMTA